MSRECLNCGHREMTHGTRDVPYEYRGHKTVITAVKGWHCLHCHEVEFGPGEGVRFAKAIKQFSDAIDTQEA